LGDYHNKLYKLLVLQNQMEETRLIQRLHKPLDKASFFAFGSGGLRNGGLSKDALEVLKNIWTFDYMGAYEFEDGSVPRALHKIANYSMVGNGYTSTINLEKEISYICETGTENYVEKLIKTLAKNKHKIRLNQPTFLERTLKDDEGFENLGGWLELDNGFLFFTDKPMYEKTLDLFKISNTVKA
jgi:hypothetical protein